MSSRHIRGPMVFNTHYIVLTGDYTVINESLVIVNKTSGAATQITLPPSVTADGRRRVIVVDGKGDAATNNITVVPDGSDTINGGASRVISENYGAVAFIDCGAGNWVVDTTANAISATELAFLNGVTAGTVSASKALVAGASSQLDALTVTTLTAPTIAGTTAHTGRTTTTDGVSSGTARVIGGLAYSNTAASTAIASTSAQTLFSTSYTLPADTLKAGTMLRIRAQGIATTTIGSDTVAYKLYIGGTGGTALISAAATDAVDNDTFQMECTLVCRTAGTTGTIVSTGTYKVSSAEGTMTVKDDITASTTINTTANQVIGVSATWNTTNANSCRLDILTVEVY